MPEESIPKEINSITKKAVKAAKTIAVYKAHLLISDFIESRPVLAPSSKEAKLRGGQIVSKTGAWGWNTGTNQWEPPTYSESKDACQLFLAKFDEMGLLVSYVKYVVNRIANGLVMEEEGDDDAEKANKLCFNMGRLMSVNADVMVVAAFQMISKIIQDQGGNVDDRIRTEDSGIIVGPDGDAI